MTRVTERCPVVLLADGDASLQNLCGISLLERSLRILQRLRFRHAKILASDLEAVERHLAKSARFRSEITAIALPMNAGAAILGESKLLVLRADFYIDPRLLESLAAHEAVAVLVDSDPPPELLPALRSNTKTSVGYMCGAALIEGAILGRRNLTPALFDDLARAAEAGEIATIDVQDQPTYLADLRRHLRPLWFPAPLLKQSQVTESLLLDAAQNGTLDLPAKVHAPIETWLVRRICQTTITPNQITLVTACVSAIVTVLFTTGRLVSGVILALAVGVLDGLDGKQARVKVETTNLGKREHVLDYVLELSWWIGLAYHFSASCQLPNAWLLLLLLIGADVVDRLAKACVKRQTARNLDDVAPIDRLVRLVGGRRNIYVWMLAASLTTGIADKAFLGVCWWGALTAAVHLLRAGWIGWRHRRRA